MTNKTDNRHTLVYDKTMTIGDIYYKKDTKQRLMYVGKYNKQKAKVQTYDNKYYVFFDIISMDYDNFVDISTLKSYSLNIVDPLLVKDTEQFTLDEQTNFLLKCAMTGIITGYRYYTQVISGVDVRELPIGKAVRLNNTTKLISLYPDFFYKYRLVRRLDLLLIRLSDTLYQLDTAIAVLDGYVTLQSIQIDLDKKGKGCYEQFRKLIKDYGYFDVVRESSYQSKVQQVCVEMHNDLYNSLTLNCYEHFLSKLDKETIDFFYFACLKKISEEQFYSQIITVLNKRFLHTGLYINIKKGNMKDTVPVVMTKELLQPYLKEFYKSVTKRLGQTGPRYSIKKLVLEKGYCKKLKYSRIEDMLFNDALHTNTYTTKEEALSDLLTKMDKNKDYRQQMLLQHFYFFRQYLINNDFIPY